MNIIQLFVIGLGILSVVVSLSTALALRFAIRDVRQTRAAYQFSIGQYEKKLHFFKKKFTC